MDLASNDYSFLSNTQGLERYQGWKGVCIEPNPQYHDNLLAKRRCTLVTNPVYSVNNHEVCLSRLLCFISLLSQAIHTQPTNPSLHHPI